MFSLIKNMNIYKLQLNILIKYKICIKFHIYVSYNVNNKKFLTAFFFYIYIYLYLINLIKK